MSSPSTSSKPPTSAEAPAPRRGLFRAIREALRGEHHDFTQGSLPRAIWLLAVPMVIELLGESVFALADIYFVSSVSDAAAAAVGITESMLTLVYAVAFGLAMSATALVARRIGEGNVDGAVRAATAAIAVGVIGGVLIGIPGFLFADDLLRLMRAPESVIEIGSGYTRIILGFNIVVMLIHLQNAIFRGAGDASLAMKSLLLANAINLVLDPCLIFGLGPFPEMGVTGAALATTIGRGIGVLFQLYLLRSKSGRISLRGPAVVLRMHLVWEILRLSIGSIGQLLIATSSWMLLMYLMAPFGETALAGYTYAIRIVIFAFLPAWGLSNAAATLVGQNLGAKEPDRAERSVWLTGLYNMIFLGVVMVVFLATAPQLVGFFTDNPDTLAVGTSALRILSYGYLFYAWGMVMTQAFNGAGDTLTPTWINFFCFWCFQLPFAWSFSTKFGFGPEGVFWSVCTAEVLLAIVAIVVFRRGKWKTTEIAEDAG